MSEAELHLLRARLRGGVLAKARTGELISPLPVGLVYDPVGRVVLDPDQGVREAVAHLFATFTRTGSARATVKAFTTEGLSFPSRVQTGPNKGTLAWLPLRHHRVLLVLHNPRYAGAFTYGRRRARRGPNGRSRHIVQPHEAWTALIPDAHPGYISWQVHEDNQRHLTEAAQARGEDRRASPVREGTALLQGPVLCARCGNRMTVRYHTRREVVFPEYLCQRKGIEDATAGCQSVPGEGLDATVGQRLLATVTPVALEVALTVQAELETRAVEPTNCAADKSNAPATPPSKHGAATSPSTSHEQRLQARRVLPLQEPRPGSPCAPRPSNAGTTKTCCTRAAEHAARTTPTCWSAQRHTRRRSGTH